MARIMVHTRVPRMVFVQRSVFRAPRFWPIMVEAAPSMPITKTLQKRWILLPTLLVAEGTMP